VPHRLPISLQLPHDALAAILEAVRQGYWERLGMLLGAHDQELGDLVSRWPSLPLVVRILVRTALSTLTDRSKPPNRIPSGPD
jgi:hypothetical protein